MKEVIDQIIKDNIGMIIITTGGGSRAISKLLENGGGSAALLDAQVPYSQESLYNIIGHVDKSVSLETITKMHNARPCRYGVFVSASLKKNEERQDRLNHAWVGYSLLKNLIATYVIFDKTASRFHQEDDLANYMLIPFALTGPINDMIAEYCPSIIKVVNKNGETVYERNQTIRSQESLQSN